MTKTFTAARIRLNGVELIQSGTDPTSGAGVAGAIGSFFLRSGTGQALLKTGAGNTDWELLTQSLEWLSVKDFGAVGNGVTDDTAAIQAAMDTCATEGGGVVYFPHGTYAVTQLTLTNQSNVQLAGTGPASIIKWVWNAATVAGSMLTISAGSDRTKIDGLTFDGSGLTNPAASRLNHLIAIVGAGGGIIETHIQHCMFTGMVAASGDGVHVVGTAGNLVSRLWIAENNFDGCSRFGVGVEQGWDFGWIVQNHFTNCETDIAYVATADLTSNSHLISGNEITHTGATRHAMRIEGGATTFVTSLVVSENVILGGFATVNRAQAVIWNANVQTSGVYASTDAVLRVFGNVADAIVTNNFTVRDAGSSAGPLVTVEKATDVPTIVRMGNNLLVNDKPGAGFIVVVDSAKVSIGGNLCHSADAGASTMFGIDVQAVTVAMGDTQIGPGNLLTADAGSMAAGVRILANGANVTGVSVVGNSSSEIDYGVQFEVGGGGGTFSGIIFYAGNNFDGAVGSYNNVGVTVRPRIGFNASTKGQNLFSGAGSPETVVTADIGSMYLRTDGGQGTAAYYKESGNGTAVGWIGLGGMPVVFGTGDTTTVATAVFLAPGWIGAASATEIQFTVTRPGTIRNLFVEVKTAGVTAATNTYTVRKNGVDTTLTTSLGNTATGAASDVTHSFTVVAGDLISISLVKSGAVATGQADVTATVEII